MKYYAKSIPIDKDGTPIQVAVSPVTALAVNGAMNVAASSVITLTQDTTAIEVATQGVGGAYIKWISTADTSGSVFGISSVGATFAANYDHQIPTATWRRFVVPIESNPATGYSSQMGANRLNGLYRRVAIVSSGISSVMVSEY